MNAPLDSSSAKLEPFRDPDQEKLFSQLKNLIGFGVASFFHDACLIINNNLPLKTPSHLVSHCVREIESSLRDCVRPLGKNNSKQKVDSNSKEDATAKKILNSLQSIVNHFKGGSDHFSDVKRTLAILEIDPKSEVAIKWNKYTTKKSFAGLTHRRYFFAPRMLDEDFILAWEDMQTIFRVVLNHFEKKLGQLLPIVRSLAKKHPSKKNVKDFFNQVPHNNMIIGAFLDSIENNQDWLIALNKKSFFGQPPEPERQIINGNTGVSFPSWSQSKHLLKIAGSEDKEIQKLVVEIILQIPLTENALVVEDFISAAIALPVYNGKRLVPMLIKSLNNPYTNFRLPQKYADLLKHLSENREKESSLQLAKELFRLNTGNDSKISTHDEWQYQQNLKNTLQPLTRVGGLEYLRLLCELLTHSIKKSESVDSREDLSYLWKEDIGNESISVTDIREHLVNAVRDCAKQLLEERLATFEQHESVFSDFDYYIFERLFLYLLVDSPDAPDQLIIKYLLKKSCFERGEGEREYDDLLSKYFSKLDIDQQNTILDWIEKEGDTSDWQKAYERDHGTRPSDSEIDERGARLMLPRLELIKGNLPDEWAKKYCEWRKKYGPGERRYAAVTTWVGPTSPKTVDELEAMPVDDLVRFLKEWKPQEGFMVDTPEGLGRLLSEAVKRKPNEYSKKALSFQGLDPTYVRSVLFGLEQAVKDKINISWKEAFDLCEWIVSQPRDAIIRVHHEYQDIDPGWGWTRKEIASLLGTGFSVGREGISCSLAGQAWRILQALLEDPDPSEDKEAKRGENLDPATMAINTVRGEAVDATVWFSIFLKECIGKNDGGDTSLQKDLEEVKSHLEKHLDKSHDSSVAVHSMFGKHFPRIAYVDEQWAKALKPLIFPLDNFPNQYWEAAWASLLAFSRIFKITHAILEEDYPRVIEYMPQERTGNDSIRFSLAERMAEYLMVIYAWGWIEGLDQPTSITSYFFSHAPVGPRARALEFIGRELWRNGKTLPPEVTKRYVELFEHRLTKAKKGQYEGYKQELENFGYWFISDAVDQTWKEGKIIEVTRLTRKLEAIHHVVEKLAGMAKTKPKEAVEVTGLLLDGDAERWFIPSYRDEIRTVIQSAISSKHIEGEKEARGLASRVYSMGYADFEDLLETKS